MASITIRNLPDEVRDTLRVRAAINGRSMEAEVRHVLVHSIAQQDLREFGPTAEQRTAMRALQTDVMSTIPVSVSLVDELIAERRLAAEQGD